jgi:predicted nucleic acid-binding protein
LALITDTGPLYAAIDRGDANHAACRSLFEQVREVIAIPAPVLVEVDHLIRARLHATAHQAFLRSIYGGRFEIVDLHRADYVRIHEICEKYADADIGLVDASLVAVAERLNEPKIATLDHRHFSIIKPRHVKSLQLLPRLTRPRPRRTLKK